MEGVSEKINESPNAPPILRAAPFVALKELVVLKELVAEIVTLLSKIYLDELQEVM